MRTTKLAKPSITTNLAVALAVASLAVASPVIGQTQPSNAPSLIDEVIIVAPGDAIRSMPGSAARIDESAIRDFNASDLNEILARVPGVYIRAEDGYGLRPNIGIRAVASDRSQKINIMEDGFLVTPAPYSAPAAYYIPNVSRLSGLEVYKGPSSIQYGPNTVGGSINLISRPVPDSVQSHIDLTLGTDSYYKVDLFHGAPVAGSGFAQPGYNIELLSYGSDGFKELDGPNSGDTGFRRNDINAKLQWQFGEPGELQQELLLKLGYADEDSDETYLGLSDADFEANPDRRYRASHLDRFESDRLQLHVLHQLSFSDDLQLLTRAYINRFDRSWLKFDNFADASRYGGSGEGFNRFDISDAQRDILSGQADSTADPATRLILTDNDRQYGSEGIGFKLSLARDFGEWQHQFEAGLRWHHDYVERNHRVYEYAMQSGSLALQNQRVNNALEEVSADAFAVHIHDEVDYRNLKLTGGLRFEYIDGDVDNQLDNTKSSNNQNIVIPGASALYQINDAVAVLAGINKGFSPVNPKSSDSADPEESINYEYGMRLTLDNLQLDLIGFFSDYDNLLGSCRASDSGCQVGEQFNAGSVEAGGLEMLVDATVELDARWSMPINLSYTYTEASFQESFVTTFSQWLDTTPGANPLTPYPTKGDEFPYIPEHQGRLQVGLQSEKLRADLAVKYVGEMREVPGVGDEGVSTEALTTVDLSFSFWPIDELRLQLVGENITDEREIVSRRPLGGRPNAPATYKVGARYEF